MEEFDLFKRYSIFLNTLNKQLGMMFENQAEYIMCKEGCSYCCEKGEYPFSKLEFDYLLEGYKKLDQETKYKILENIAKINEEKAVSKEETFMHVCPFLINKRCSVYEHRGIICRTFGLLCEHDDGRLTMPFCNDLGLNYSKVYDPEVGQITSEKIDACGGPEPKAYRISRDNIQNISIAKNLDIEWGESKTMLDCINESNIVDL